MPSLIHACGRDVRIEGRFLRIARLDADRYQFLDDPEVMLRPLRTSGFRIDLFTFMQRLPETLPKYPYPMEWDNLAVLPVTTFEQWWTKQIDNKTRNMVRKAEKKGILVREVPFNEALVQGIWEIYNEWPVRQGGPFRLYGVDLQTVRKVEAMYLENSIFIGAFLGDSLIGFVKLIHDETRTQAGLRDIVSMIRHRDKAPTNALVAQAVRSCAERGISYLVYSNFARGKRGRDSLSDFKEHSGFKRIDLPRYYVPLTRTGWAGLRLGLHHRFVDRLPALVVAKLRELRKAWYACRF